MTYDDDHDHDGDNNDMTIMNCAIDVNDIFFF